MKFAFFHLVNAFLNPILIPLYIVLFGENDQFFVLVGTNSSKMFPAPYLIFCTLFGIGTLAFQFAFHKITHSEQTFLDFSTPNRWWIAILPALLDALIVWSFVSDSGVEGNIMGFIYFPMCVFGSLCFSFLYVSWLLKHWVLPEKPLSLNFKLKVLLHSFNPFLILFYSAQPLPEYENGGIAPVLIFFFAITIFNFLWFPFYWLGFKFFKRPLNLQVYFGEQNTILYFIPYAFGIFLTFYLNIAIHIKMLNSLNTFFLPVVWFLTAIMCSLWFFNHVRFFLNLKS